MGFGWEIFVDGDKKSLELNLAIGRMLRNKRKEQALTQRDLADLFGITQAGVAAIEAGRMNLTVPMLIKLNEAYDIDAKEFLGPLLPEPQDSQTGHVRREWASLYATFQGMNEKERPWLGELLDVIQKRPR